MANVAVWGDFEVHFDEVLGRGGMGTVYCAVQRSLNRKVAVKVLHADRIPDPELVEGFLEKFQVEIRALSRLQDGRIVTIIQAGKNDGNFWFAMELIEGRTVEKALFDDGAFPVKEAVRVGTEVARALDAAFRQGINHRDVKPANIFLVSDGSVKLADFGLARSEAFTRTRLTDLNAVACTPAYAAPEQAEGKPTDHRSDIYSLGCVLYEMVTERPPFQGASPMETLYRHSKEPPPSPRLLNPAVTLELEAVILKCLSKNPEERYGSYAELIRDLERPAPVEAAAGFGLWPWAAAAGAALIGVILTAIFLNVKPVPAEEPAAILTPAAVEKEHPEAPKREAGVPIPVAPAPKPKPERKAAPPEPVVAPARPSPEDLETVARFLDLSRSFLEQRVRFQFKNAISATEEFAGRPEVTPWVRPFVEAEQERLGAAARRIAEAKPFEAGRRRIVVVKDGRVFEGRVVAVDPAELTVELKTGFREAIPLPEVSPETFAANDLSDRERILFHAGAGNAAAVVGELGKLDSAERRRHETGIVDAAIEEALRAAAQGRLELLERLEVSPGQREALTPIVGERIKRFDTERAAAVLYGKRAKDAAALGRLLRDFPTTFAGVRAAADVLTEFQDRCETLREETPKEHFDFSELVGVVPWATWRTDAAAAPGGRARLQAESNTYLLEAAGTEGRLWFVKKLRGAQRGYSVRWRWGSGAEPTTVLAVALSPKRWVEFSAAAAALYRLDEDGNGTGRSRVARKVDLIRPFERGVCAVVPLESHILIYLDDRLLFVLPETEYALDEGVRLGVGGGVVILESVRVTDRSRD